mmetsp:Transcript_16991/g.25581  ORF Transcript_16991/g.25581 Transcript_16991/m.25581 type:complete len:84 (+) Transcript_16991:826-1077(+)
MAWILHDVSFPNALKLTWSKGADSCTSEGIGNVVAAMARDATMSQKLIKAIMMWYGEASFDRVLRMISITAMDDIAEMHPLTM